MKRVDAAYAKYEWYEPGKLYKVQNEKNCTWVLTNAEPEGRISLCRFKKGDLLVCLKSSKAEGRIFLRGDKLYALVLTRRQALTLVSP